MKQPKDMTDDEISEEWYRLAKINVAEITEDEKTRFLALDQEAFNRKYNVRK